MFELLKFWEWNIEICNRVIALSAITGLLWVIKPIKGFIKNLWNKISLHFERFKFLLSDEFQLSVRVGNYLHNLDDCCIWINKDVIGDEDNKDYMISPMLLTIICNVIENEIENYCDCGGMTYIPINYCDYLYYIKTGKIKPNTLDDRRVSALKRGLNLCKDNLSYSHMGVELDKAGLPWSVHNINIKPKWNI